MVDENLSMREHTKTICKNAETKANLVFRALHTNDVKTLVNAYCVYVRPSLEFSSSVSRPINSTDRDKIEKVQNSVTRRIFYKALNYTYHNRPSHYERNKELQLHSLEYRRMSNDARLAYQMLFGNGKLAESMRDFFTLIKTRTRGAGYKVVVDSARLKLRENSIAHRITNRLISILQKGNLPTSHSEYMMAMLDEKK
jgi:hypothetical protein